MTTITTNLWEPTAAPSPGTVAYTSENCETALDKITAVNTTGSNAVITLTLTLAGGGVLAISKTIAGGKTWPFPDVVGQVLDNGGTVTQESVPTLSIKTMGSGRQFT